MTNFGRDENGYDLSCPERRDVKTVSGQRICSARQKHFDYRKASKRSIRGRALLPGFLLPQKRFETLSRSVGVIRHLQTAKNK